MPERKSCDEYRKELLKALEDVFGPREPVEVPINSTFRELYESLLPYMDQPAPKKLPKRIKYQTA